MSANQALTKAQTLAFLSKIVTKSRVLPLKIVKQGDYFRQPDTALQDIRAFFSGAASRVIVRSSCTQEDSEESSNAGKFESVLDVDVQSPKALSSAIEKVFTSYQNAGEDEGLFIQPMLENVVRSGVAFTCDVYTGAPYFTINYSDGKDNEKRYKMKSHLQKD